MFHYIQLLPLCSFLVFELCTFISFHSFFVCMSLMVVNHFIYIEYMSTNNSMFIDHSMANAVIINRKIFPAVRCLSCNWIFSLFFFFSALIIIGRSFVMRQTMCCCFCFCYLSDRRNWQYYSLFNSMHRSIQTGQFKPNSVRWCARTQNYK